MQTVGVKVLKNGLSRYLDLVKQGQVIIITENKKVIAEIRAPYSGLTNDAQRLEKYIDDLAQGGRLIRAKPGPSKISAIIKKYGKKPNNLDWRSVYDQVRSERF